ncbi:MAG: FAD-dependent oxidoreductase [Thermaerobacter sp.]|nr:FAD-dependent oxidoreductase [Thermaerobacter sp.]
MPHRIVIIGGDGAGMSAASQAKRRDPSLDIVAFEQGPVVSYSACSIPYYVGRVVDTMEPLIARTPEAFRQMGIDVRTGHEVQLIDRVNQRIQVQAAGTRRWEPYDDLVLATGASPIIPPWPGVDADGVFVVKTLEDGRRIRQYIETRHPRTAVVVGGGYIGLEMAENLQAWGIQTTLLEQQAQVMPTFLDADMASLVNQALTALAVTVSLNDEVLGFQITQGRVRAVQTRHQEWPADLVILGLGVRPQSALAREAGIPLGIKDAVRVNPYLKTQVPHVWAVGDVAETRHLVTGKPIYIALATVANKQGRIAGLNLSGSTLTFSGVLGTAITRVGPTEIARTGLTPADAEAADLAVRTTRVETETKLGYFPDVSTITVKLVAETGTGRLLGAQIVGGPGSGKRIDTIAAAVTARMTVTDLIDLDLAYAPPFSDVWDPVQVAARTLVSKI